MNSSELYACKSAFLAGSELGNPTMNMHMYSYSNIQLATNISTYEYPYNELRGNRQALYWSTVVYIYIVTFNMLIKWLAKFYGFKKTSICDSISLLFITYMHYIIIFEAI